MDVQFIFHLKYINIIIYIIILLCLILYKKQSIEKFINIAIYRSKVRILSRRIEHVYETENFIEYKKLLIENSLLKIGSGDYNKTKIGLAELYIHAENADLYQVNKIYFGLLKVIKSESNDSSRDAIVEAICYFNNLRNNFQAVG